MYKVITIPQELMRSGELVLIPKKEYEMYLKNKMVYSRNQKLDQDLQESLSELKSGKAIGPFKNSRDLFKSLRTAKKL